MKSGKRIWIAASLAICGAVLLHGQLEPWVQHTPAGPAIAALFRTVSMPGGDTPILRPPAEARSALTSAIAAAPGDAPLYRLRAQVAEMALDFPAAEADWKAYTEHAPDKYPAQIELADFYHRQMRSKDELATLTLAAAAPDDPIEPAAAQRGWQAYQRMAALTTQDALPEAEADPVFRGWVARYPKELAAWHALIDHLAAQKLFAAAESEIAAYGRAFHDDLEPLRMRADLEVRRGNPSTALAVYDRAFRPLWPDEMRARYFKLLADEGQLREFAGRARTALAANPADLDAAARLFHYFRSQNNTPAARRVLLEYRIAKESGKQPWTADELQTTAQLFDMLPDVNEAARLYYALYSVPPAGGAHAEHALNGLAHLLLTAPDQPIQFGSGDLSFYKDIGTVDPSPGFLNGILSLLLNWTGARSEYDRQNQKSEAYFHRAVAEQLVGRLDREFPNSPDRDALHAALVSAYGVYGDNAEVIRSGREYLTAFPNGGARVPVALQVSDALARTNRTTEEFALYDQLLRELAAKASGVPIGNNTVPKNGPQVQPGLGLLSGVPAADDPDAPQPNLLFRGGPIQRQPSGARSDEYVQVLDKYLSRLAALRRPLDALRVYRGEIDRNPNDPGLYERLATFVEQNNMSREVEDVYTKAIAKFADRSWYHKLARWYLRTKESAALEKISRDAIAVFSGSELENYFGDVVHNHPDAMMYRQLNLYAHDRFPEDLVFVRNLLAAYTTQETYDAAAHERLLRQYWFYDARLAAQLFERLSQQGRLAGELAQVRAANPSMATGKYDQAVSANPAAVQFVVEAETWSSHFEAAAPEARALAEAYPGRREFTAKASSLYRSLAAYDPRDTTVAVTLAGHEHSGDLRNPEILARMGDICADRELFTRARTFWQRMPATQPGKPEVYLDTAAVYWDYYRYDDALRWIAAARTKFANPALFGFQAGAIYEGRRNFGAAVREYVAAGLRGDQPSRNRLVRLLNRTETRGLVDRATEASAVRNPTPSAISLRLAILERMQRRPDIEKLLQTRVEAEKSSGELRDLQEQARRLGFDRIEERAGERLAAITNDPVDKMRLTLANARLLESKKDLAGAARVVDTLYRDHPLILGVLRGTVDFHVRNRQPVRAIDLLLDAAKHARADLAGQFTLEAARIATNASDFTRARTLLTSLLQADPLRAEYLTAMGETYLQAKDDAGFRDYQLAVIQRLKQAPLTPADRIARIAIVRRSLIPALDRLKDSAGAVDQYIELINSYPEDESLTKEASAYAVSHSEAPRMVVFYRKTVNDAPRDYRWPIVLGRIETVTEDYPSAIADYERGIKARPDRADIVEAKAKLEERLMRFTDAIQSYQRLYELAYRDPQWLIKVAELDARSRRNADAVKALQTAIIGARTETADADFQIASQLADWQILPDAVSFAERGANLAGGDLFQQTGNALIYSKIMAHARRMEMVLPQLGKNPATDQQVIPACGKIVAEEYTPEEKAHLAQAMGAPNATLMPLAESAGLTDLEARWREQRLQQPAQQVDSRLVTLQSQRGMYGALGQQLEDYAAKIAGRPAEAGALTQSIDAFRQEGDVDGELRVMRKALARHALGGMQLDRYLTLLAASHPDELLALVRANGPADVRNRAVESAIASDKAELAYSAVQARGASLPPVWGNAFTALAGDYFSDRSPAIDAAFQAVLDTRTIGERLQAPRKPDSVIVGSVWFYYGARYGDHLAAAKNPEAEAWLPATLEASPRDADAYMSLGDSYVEAGQTAEAITQFRHAIELDNDRGDALDHIARAQWREGRQAEAVAEWKASLGVFLRIQSRGVRVPESFWPRVAATFTAIGENHALDPLHGDIANLLSDYYHRNDSYRLRELIGPAVRASISSGFGSDWLLALGRSIGEPQMMLSTLMRTEGVTPAQRIALQREMVDVITRQGEASFGDNQQSFYNQGDGAREQLIGMLLDAGDVQAASAEWAKLPPPRPPRYQWDRDTTRENLEIRLAAKTGTLAALLERFRAKPETAPQDYELRQLAQALRRGGDPESARSLLEFSYDRAIRKGELTAANFVGLAEVKLERGDTPAALALLNRMALVSEEGFDSLPRAAELLAQYGKTSEATDFVRRRMQAVPWDASARLQLASDLPAGSGERAKFLADIVADSQAAYGVRAKAARMAGSASGAGPGTELAVLSSPAVSPAGAEKPYFLEARIAAAGAATDPQTQLRLWREALAIAPADDRARLGALRAAIGLRRDSLALALARTGEQPPEEFQSGAPSETPPPRWASYRGPAAVLPRTVLPDRERASLAEQLAAAAERLDDLATAQDYLRAAFNLQPEAQRAPLQSRIDALQAEIDRRSRNAARQPIVKDFVEQGHVVRPRIPRSQP